MAQIREKRIVNDGINQTDEQYKLFALLQALINQIKGIVNNLRTNGLIASGMKTTAGLKIGSTAANVASIAFGFMINGINYYKAAVAAGTAPAAETIPQNKYGLFRYEIDAAGTISCAGAAANATGYATEALAIAALPATTAANASLGYFTVMSTNAAGFVGATTSLAHADATVAYYSSAVMGPAAVALDDIDLLSLGV